jgi:tRNA U55 pseudouridine synthase TruB
MSTPTLHQTLQKQIGAVYGDSLPTSIKFHDRTGDIIEKELADVTLDEIAFAMQLLHAESAAIHARRSALERLYNLAREHRCMGSDTVNVIAMEVTK